MKIFFEIILLVAPNLMFLLNQISTETPRKVFDQGFFGKDQQLWIRYQDNLKQAFQGVWATKNNQKKIVGFKNQNTVSLWSPTEKWVGQIKLGPHPCRSYLELHKSDDLAEKWIFWLDHCLA